MAKSEGVSGDMNALLREAVKSCGGKGGGTKDFAQGSVPEGSDLDRILRHAAERAAKPAPALHVVSEAFRERKVARRILEIQRVKRAASLQLSQETSAFVIHSV